jgi:hypothetical protein
VTSARAREVTERALAEGGAALAGAGVARAVAQAPGLFAALWPHLREDADARGVVARTGLARRARKESDELRMLLERQRTAIRASKGHLGQTVLFEVGDKLQKRQIELDIEHLERREERIAVELEEEPKAIEALYEVQMTRLTPVGLVIAWPEAMT